MPVLLSCGMLRKINLPLSLSFRGKLIKIMAVPESGEVIPQYRERHSRDSTTEWLIS